MIYITIYKIDGKLLKIATKKYAFFFPDSESLTKAVLFLINNIKTKVTESSLYILKGKYILIAENLTSRTVGIINEFCYNKTDSPIKIEFIKEYGRPLIINDAINRYGVAFLKKSE